MGSRKFTRPTSMKRTIDRIGREVVRQSAQPRGCGAQVVFQNPIAPTFVDAEIYDNRETATLLNRMVEACCRCNTRTQPLAALIRFPQRRSEMALCGECYGALLKLALGQIT